MDPICLRGVGFHHRDVLGRNLGGGVFGIDLDIKPGRILCLIGPNGSGKSTIIKLCMGFASPMEGTIGMPVQASLSYISDGGRSLYPSMTLKQNIDYVRALKGAGCKRASGETVLRMSERLHLDEPDKLVSHMSRGMRQKASIILALTLSHDFLLADEPTLGLDEPSQNEFEGLLVEEKESGKGICLATNDIGMAARIADISILLEKGSMKGEGILGPHVDGD